MEYIKIMIIAMVICFLVMIISQLIFWRNRKLARKNIITDWSHFLDAEQSNDVDLINLYGDKLIWNRYISQDQIDKLNESLTSRLLDHPKLANLYTVTKNRRSYLSDDERLRIYITNSKKSKPERCKNI